MSVLIKDSWVEKYRPRKLDDVVSQHNIIKTLQGIIKTKNMPHFLFYGPSGCGKTSTILALARELFTEEYINDRVIELNASDERGINAVREKIKKYARQSINHKTNIPPWKIIILDEADNMTSESQFALRKIMEDYSQITRFCIICNYYNKIIEPIVSRCSLLRFKPIDEKYNCKKINSICKNENIHISEENINNILKICRGDLRKSINFIQRCSKYNNNINKDIINEISGYIPLNIINRFINTCYSKNITEMNKYIEYFYNNAYSLTNQIKILIDIIMEDNKFNDKQKSQIILKLVEIDKCLLNNGDEYIEYYKLGYFIASL